MPRHLIGLGLLALSMPLLADQASPLIRDQTGTYLRLDIARILESTDLTRFCGVQTARLEYLDHLGRTHLLEYPVAGHCSSEN